MLDGAFADSGISDLNGDIQECSYRLMDSSNHTRSKPSPIKISFGIPRFSFTLNVRAVVVDSAEHGG